MSVTTLTPAVEIEALDALEPLVEETPRPALRERGMVTIEYAIGAVLVIATIGVVLMAIRSGVLGDVIPQFIRFLFTQMMNVLMG